MLNGNNWSKILLEKGFFSLQGVLDASFINKMNDELMQAVEKEAAYHGTTDYTDYGRILLAPLYEGSFLEILADEKVMKPFEIILGKECILYTMTSSCLPPYATHFSGNIHVDTPRIIPGYLANMVGMVLLDDFTLENGATYFLPNSQLLEGQPEETYFYKNAERFTGKAGDICFFHPRIWHKSGENKTGAWRRSLLIGMIRPWLKQRFDIPRAMAGKDLSAYPDKVKQKLGFYTQPPASYDEFYKKSAFQQKPV